MAHSRVLERIERRDTGSVVRESKEDEREDSRVKEASSVDRRENCSGDGREARTDEARVEGERDFGLRREVII